jgi:hypothetical protein
MSQVQAQLLDLELAWRRVRADQSDRVFVREPYAQVLIEQNVDEWLNEIREMIRNDTYHPGTLTPCFAPKGNGVVRLGSHLALRDQLVYAACVGACLQMIREAVRWSRRTVDYSYQLNDNDFRAGWLRNRYDCWQDFRNASINAVTPAVTYIVLTDVAGFYDHIDLALLSSDLRALNCPIEIIGMISTCLNAWAPVPGRGIPQGLSASDILAKLYLNSVDQNLRQMGHNQLRYVDDYRVFCGSRHAAKRALLDIAALMRQRGLSIQGAKTEILRVGEARANFEQVLPTLRALRAEFIREVVARSHGGDPYMPIWEAERLLHEQTPDEPIEVIRRAYEAYFQDEDAEFDKTLFHFLLGRLGAARDNYAFDHAIGLIGVRPEETSYILAYTAQVEAIEDADEELAVYLASPDSVYDYQNYLIIEWRAKYPEVAPSQDLIRIVREMAFDDGRPSFLKSISRRFLEQFGTQADLERIEQLYATTTSPLEQVEILCALRRLEGGRRNAFLGRHAGATLMHQRAGRYARGL